jgi:hypothetical protein
MFLRVEVAHALRASSSHAVLERKTEHDRNQKVCRQKPGILQSQNHA